MAPSGQYTERQRLLKALLIVTSLQKRDDLKAYRDLKSFIGELDWADRQSLMIEERVWDYAVNVKHYDPRFVFCHPDVLQDRPSTSLYYRGMCGLSIKAAKTYFGAVENTEKRSSKTKLSSAKALKMAQTYNTFICSIVTSSAKWTLENGHRTIIATLGITLDGVMRNRVGDLAEQQVRRWVMDYLIDRDLLVSPRVSREQIQEKLPVACELRENVLMRYGSEPDIAFSRGGPSGGELLAVVEIKGGTDPAGALERYGAAKKSFEHSLRGSPRCRSFFLSAVYTQELRRRIGDDRLVEKYYDIVEMIEKPEVRDAFFQELFHFTLRLE
jgi:hypothetical protein